MRKNEKNVDRLFSSFKQKKNLKKTYIKKTIVFEIDWDIYRFIEIAGVKYFKILTEAERLLAVSHGNYKGEFIPTHGDYKAEHILAIKDDNYVLIFRLKHF